MALNDFSAAFSVALGDWMDLSQAADGSQRLTLAEFLRERVGATRFRLMPAKTVFTLGVGHWKASV